ncbi:MAG: hypothetical protein J0I29_11115 [Rhizobiales bacterium]|nr:hypothetical protein [Hyphomicrobiales bacterium]
MLYAQDIEIGRIFPFGTYRMEEAEILDFANKYDPLFIHNDPAAAKNGPFGGIIASGLHTMAVYQRLIAEALWWHVAGIAGKRFEIDLQRPVRPGMVLTGQAQIVDIVHRPEKKDAIFTIRSEVTDGTKPVVLIKLDALIAARPD